MASKKPKKVHPGLAETWEVRRASMVGPRDELIVTVIEVSEPFDKGARDVKCLVLEALSGRELPGAIVTLTNGAFNHPNRRIA